jgi:hypothetical protein
MKKVSGKVPDKGDALLLWGLSLFPILTPPTIPQNPTQDQTHL